MNKDEIALELLVAHEILDGLHADNDEGSTTGDPRYSQVLRMIAACRDALQVLK